MGRNNTSPKQKCSICGKLFAPNGFKRHQKSCQNRVNEEESAARYHARLNHSNYIETAHEPQRVLEALEAIDQSTYFVTQTRAGNKDLYPEYPDFHEDEQSLAEYDHTPDECELQPDDIKIEYHPASGKPARIMRFQEYGEQRTHDSSSEDVPDPTPWKPWRSRVDFEVAALALESFMSEDQTNRLIDILNRVACGRDNFTLVDHKETQKLWDLAAEQTVKFQQTEISVKYRDEEPEIYELYYRPVWDWIQELVRHKVLVSKMEWHAQRMYRYDSSTKKWKRFIEEAWSASSWWKIQDKLPTGAVPLCLVFYADKSKLSSFGTAKGYPVIVRCANLSMGIRNGSGQGGGRVVGWLPIVTEDAHRSGKTDFANFKTIVWHESVRKIFESIVPHSKTGYTMLCGDQISRTLNPCILIGSADYEEQCVICLTRGIQSLCPCVKCECPKDELSNFEKDYARRTAQGTVEIVNKALQLAQTSKGESQALLKEHSLRPWINSFFWISNSDPYEAVSFDDLHFLDSGVWDDHLLEVHRWHLKKSGRTAAVTVDNRFKMFPRWSKLHHFGDGISKITFNDGSKNHDISKIYLFAAHDVITKQEDKAGYSLLKVTQHYMNMIMYAGLEVQTSDTIAEGRTLMKVFANALQKYRSIPTELEKNWDFVKLHYLQHCWDDIESKGVLRGMSTKPNEKFHGPLRKIYLRQTNFKDTVMRIFRVHQ